MEGGPPIFRQDFTCPALLKDLWPLSHTGLSPISPDFPDRSATQPKTTGLFRFRSPLLAESLLMSFPPGTEMFQFPGFASTTYEFSRGSPSLGGLPHSDIHGSKPARGSPWLFAACHVLHRLLMPRHPPNALLIRFVKAASRQKPRSAEANPNPKPPTAITMHRSKPECAIPSSLAAKDGQIRKDRRRPAPAIAKHASETRMVEGLSPRSDTEHAARQRRTRT